MTPPDDAASPAPTQPTAASWPDVLATLLRGEDLSAADAGWAMAEVMSGEATPSQVAGFVMALRAKGETAAEVGALVDVMLTRAVRVVGAGPSLDVVGTGGDRAHTVNISTMAAIVAAAAGARVVKHGNRAASSTTGTADVLEELGVVIALPATAVVPCVEQAGIAFCFAPTHHPAMRHAAVPRRELGVPTVFNVLGPLANPAEPAAALIGCADARLAPVMAGVLAARGVRALVVRGDDGLDEITTATTTTVWDTRAGDGSVALTTLDPAALGIPVPEAGALRGGEAAHNAAVVRAVMAGEQGAAADAVMLNAAAALAVWDVAVGAGDPAMPLADAVASALPRARAVAADGRATALLDRWVATTQHLAQG